MPVENDFLTWTSFPSSIKYVNPSITRGPWKLLFINLPVTPGSTMRATLKAKEENAKPDPTNVWGLQLYTSPETAPPPVGGQPTPWGFFHQARPPTGTHDWMEVLAPPKTVPADRRYLMAYLVGSAGSPEVPAITWFDDLKIYQDDVLIYSNDFSNWTPVIISTGIATAEIITGVAMIKFIK